MKENSSYFSPVPASILIGSIVVAIAILMHGGIIKLKGIKGYAANTPTTTTTTTTPAVAGAAAEPAAANPEEANKKIIAFAEGIGLDTDKFTSCLADPKQKEEVTSDLQAAQTAGADATPTFFVGQSGGDTITAIKLVGAQPFSAFKAAIDSQLAGTKPSASESATVSVDDDAVEGDVNAPITLVEFSDYECPFCKRHFTETYQNLKTEYIDTGKVKLVFRDLPLSFHDPMATQAAIGANCAREQGGDQEYYKYHDAYFSKTQSNGSGV